MITWMAALFLVAGFLVLMRVFGLPGKGKAVIQLARRSLDVIRSPNLTDSDKEASLQAHSKQLFLLFLQLTAGTAAALALPFALVWLFSLRQWVSLDSVFALTLSARFLALSGLLTAMALWPASQAKGEAGSYSRLDRVLHRLAFSTYTAHLPLADLETRMVARPLGTVKLERPVFITALPRAGTTLLLECCAGLPDFASHCYRDMPFVLTPCLWNRFSSSFRQQGESKPRAHGDGMLIHFDSPEALEEVVWAAFWQPHYRPDRLLPWGTEDRDGFADFFRDHMRKIVLLRRGPEAGARYISKNNGNIARTALLRRLFPDSIILVPFRDPVQHAFSLLGQHLNFLRIHEQDPFACAYMRAIGHFDFGRNLRPIDFNNWFDRRTTSSALSLAFWIEYWIAGYEHLLADRGNGLHFLHYERFCERPEQGLGTLATLIGTRHAPVLLEAAGGIHPVRPRDVDVTAVPPDLILKANALYTRLQQAAENP